MKEQTSAFVIAALLERPKTTREITDEVGRHFSVVHRHLQFLKDMGLVTLHRPIFSGLTKRPHNVYAIGPKVKEWAKKNATTA